MKPWFYRRAKVVPLGAYARFYPAGFRGWALVIAVGLLVWLVWFKGADWFGPAFVLGWMEIPIPDVLAVAILVAALGVCWRLSAPDPSFETDADLNADKESENA
jgi:hypothetical protein